MEEWEKERERGEENGTDYIAKLLFAQAGVIFDYIGQRISCVGVQKRGGRQDQWCMLETLHPTAMGS